MGKMTFNQDVKAQAHILDKDALSQCGAALIWEIRNNRKFARQVKGTMLEKRLETVFAKEYEKQILQAKAGSSPSSTVDGE
jgi:hypothetical protein